MHALSLAIALLTVVGVSRARAQEPCDILASAGTPCVAAHSTVRALYANYDGPLYQVGRASDGATQDIGLLSSGGYANAASQDAFCAGTTCIITRIYDQSPEHNDLTIEGAGATHPNGPLTGAPANALATSAGGHQVYGVEISGGMGYRDDNAHGTAVNVNVPAGSPPSAYTPESMYMVTSGQHVNSGCCFDYGNVETSNSDTGNGHMDAINFGTECFFGNCGGSTGPWVLADMENGLFEADTPGDQNPSYTGNPQSFVSAFVKNDSVSRMSLKSGDATTGALTTIYEGGEPANQPGYMPMHQEGAIVLGTGGDVSSASVGSFFEGVMTAGYPSDQTEQAIEANIVAVGYGAPTGTNGTLTPGSEVMLNAVSGCCTDDYLSQSTTTTVTPIQIEPLASTPAAQQFQTWIVRPGLADPSCLSFESKAAPGDYIRHSNYMLYHSSDDGDAQLQLDATFCASTPGNGGEGSSFQSYNYPGRFIRHFDYQGYIAADGGPYIFDNPNYWTDDTTFLVLGPASP